MSKNELKAFSILIAFLFVIMFFVTILSCNSGWEISGWEVK